MSANPLGQNNNIPLAPFPLSPFGGGGGSAVDFELVTLAITNAQLLTLNTVPLTFKAAEAGAIWVPASGLYIHSVIPAAMTTTQALALRHNGMSNQLTSSVNAVLAATIEDTFRFGIVSAATFTSGQTPVNKAVEVFASAANGAGGASNSVTIQCLMMRIPSF